MHRLDELCNLLLPYVLFLRSVIFLAAGTLPSLSAINEGQILYITNSELTPAFI